MIARATGDTRSLAQHFGALAAQVNTEGKERLLEAAVRMAVSDGSLQPQELDTLATMARALGVSDAHLKGIVSQNTPPPA